MKPNSLSNIDIILYSLYFLRGGEKKIPTETVTIKCHELAQDRFSWIIYPEYPDKEIVRRSLIEARSGEGYGLVTGRHGKSKENQAKEGWILTPDGINWIKENSVRIQSLLQKPERIKTNRTQIKKKISHLLKTSAYKKFINEKNINNVKDYEFTNFLSASLDSPSSVLQDRLDKIKALAASVNRKEIVDFLNLSEKKFRNILNIK